MDDRWTIDVLADLRKLDISQKEFAMRCGYSEPYMSQLLRGRKGTEQARKRIEQELAVLKLGPFTGGR